MNEEWVEWVVCKRAVPGEEPYVPSQKDICAKCGSPVWRAHSSPQHIQVVCIECCFSTIEPGETVQVMPPNEAQLAEIEAWKKRHPR
jgi:recombinational DNA repair protein (RecF pathway)